MEHKSKKPSSTSKLQEQLKGDQETEMLEHPSYEELQQKLEEAENKATENWDRALRMQAEMDNLNRRVERDIANAHKYGLEKFALELLPVIDNMERSLQIPDEAKVGHEAVLEGIRLTLQMFQTALQKFGIEEVNPVGEAFNPDLHQAISVQSDAGVKPGTVLNVLQKGYLLNNRLIRPALVVVSK